MNSGFIFCNNVGALKNQPVQPFWAATVAVSASGTCELYQNMI